MEFVFFFFFMYEKFVACEEFCLASEFCNMTGSTQATELSVIVAIQSAVVLGYLNLL
jgi:hypothetical protein